MVTGVMVLLVASVLLVYLPGVTKASPAIPAPNMNPNPASSQATDAQSYAKTSTSAYEEDTTSFYNASFSTANPPNWNLVGGHQVLKNPFKGSLTLLAGVTWINLTASCGGGNQCPGTYACDGQTSPTFRTFPLTYKFTVPCLNFYLNSSAPLKNQPSEPEFTILRMQNFIATNPQGWVSQKSNLLEFSNLTSFGYGMYGPSFVPTFYSDRTLTWWVPYPSGAWYQPMTTLQSVDFGTVYPQTDYAILTSSFLVQWSNFPADGTNYTYHFLFTLITQTGQNSTVPPCSGCGGGGSQPNNSGAPPPTVIQLNELVLQLGNLTLESGGYWQQSVIYTNTLPYNFTGEYFLESASLLTASNVSLYVNSVPQPPFVYGVGQTAVTLFSGVITVATGTSVSFVIQFQIVSQFSFYGTLFYLGSTAVTIWNIVAVGGLVTVAFVIWWDFRNPERSRLQDGLLGSGLMVLFILAVLTL